MSRDLTFDKIVIGLFLALFLYVSSRSFDNWQFLVIGTLVIGGIGFSTFYLPDTIEFDNDNMYVQTRGDEIVVDLKDINTVKLTGFRMNHRYMWKIKYTLKGLDKAARFYPIYSGEFDSFTTLVKSKNPGAEIIYESSFLDFDM